MGTFGGHALPGSFFIMFALWWTVQMFHRYYTSQKKKTVFQSTAIFNCSCLCGKLKELPLEAFVKLIFVAVGFFGEIYTGFSSDGRFVNLGNGQHATMFFFFGFTGVVDILVHFKAPLPPDLDYVSVALAVVCEFTLFKFHLHGRTDLDVHLHTLLIYVIGASLLSIIAEMRFRNSVLCALTRAYFTLLQGTWFWQVGWILYPPFKNSYHWDHEDHDQMMISTMIFAWHLAVDFILMLGIGGAVALYHRRCGHRLSTAYTEFGDSLAMERLHSGTNGRTVHVKVDEESESEVEFEKQPMIP